MFQCCCTNSPVFINPCTAPAAAEAKLEEMLALVHPDVVVISSINPLDPLGGGGVHEIHGKDKVHPLCVRPDCVRTTSATRPTQQRRGAPRLRPDKVDSL